MTFAFALTKNVRENINVFEKIIISNIGLSVSRSLYLQSTISQVRRRQKKNKKASRTARKTTAADAIVNPSSYLVNRKQFRRRKQI